MQPMKNSVFARRAGAAVLALALGAAGAQQAAPAAAPAQPAASNPAAVLPQWAQDRLAAAKADPKVHDQAYRQGARLATFCANCHGPNGQSVKPDVPNLAGQNTIYVLNQLNKFHDGRRKGAFFMEGLVKAMSNDERFAVAVYYTNQEVPRPQALADARLAAQGKAVYDNGCKKCHGESGAGSEKNSRLAGQQPGYLETSIRRYRENDVRADEKMFKYTKGLTDAEIKALVAYIAGMR
jgi:cytochrome c553